MPRDGEERCEGNDQWGRPIISKFNAQQNIWYRKTNRGKRGGEEKRREYQASVREREKAESHRPRSRSNSRWNHRNRDNSYPDSTPSRGSHSAPTQHEDRAARAPPTHPAQAAPAPNWLQRGNSSARAASSSRPPEIPPPPSQPPPAKEQEVDSYTYTSPTEEEEATNPYISRSANSWELENLSVELQERAKRAQEALSVATQLEKEACTAEEEVAQASKKAKVLRARADLAKEESHNLDRAFTSALAREQASKQIKRDFGISESNREAAPSTTAKKPNPERSPILRPLSRNASETSLTKTEVKTEGEGSPTKDKDAAVKREPSAGPIKTSSPVKTERVSSSPKPSVEASKKGSLTAPVPQELRQTTPATSSSATPDFVLTIDYNDTLAIPNPKSRERRPELIIPREHTEAVRKVLRRGINVVVLSFAVKKANEVARSVRNWELFKDLYDFQIVNQRSGSSFWREFVDDDNRHPGYTSGGKDNYLATRGWVAIIDDSDEITTACERQGIQTYRIKTAREDHPKRAGENQNHWQLNRGIFDSFPQAVDSFLADFDRNRLHFRTCKPFWSSSKFVKWKFRYQD